MLNETDLLEFYEWLEKKKAEAKQATPEHATLLDQQIALIQDLIRLQQRMLGIRL